MGDCERRVQTVFLVDLAVFQIQNRCTHEKLKKCILLTAFRILNYFQSLSRHLYCDQSDHKLDKFKWGFKIFDSLMYKGGRNKHNLKEFKLKYFEEFQKEIEDCYSCILKIKTSPCLSNDGKKNGKSRNICAAENLSKALNEILHDFQWEMPELYSPMKGRKKHLPVNSEQLVQCNKNYVFLLSTIPHSAQELRSFCGKKVMDEDIFMDSFMSPSLYQMFYVSTKLSLFWIDLDSDNDPRPFEPQTFEIINKCLQKIGGTYIPLKLLLELPFSSVSHNEASVERLTNILNNCPTESVLNHKLQVNRKGDQCTTYEACLNVVHGTQNTDIPILLTRMTDDIKSTSENHNNIDGKRNSLSVALSPDVWDNRACNARKKVNINIVDCPVNKDEHPCSRPSHFIIIGCVTDEEADLHCVPVHSTFLCTNVGDEVATDCILHQIIQGLIKDNKKLVVLSTSVIPYIGILESVSETSGLLTLYRVGSSLQIEKALLNNQEKQEEKINQSNNTDNQLMKFSHHLTQNKLNALGSQFNQQSIDIKNSLRGERCLEGSKFHRHTLEKWHLPGSSEAVEHLINKLNKRLDDLEFLNGSEKKTLKSLQKLYRKQNQPPKLSDICQGRELNYQDENAMSASDVNMSTSTVVDGGFPLKRQKSSTLSRTDIIIHRSKHVQKRKSSETSCSNLKTKEDSRQSVDLSAIKLETDEGVSQYIKDVHNTCLMSGDQLESSVRSLVTVVLHYMKSQDNPHPEESTRTLIEKTIMLSSSKLREKYKGKDSEADIKEKITQYQLQILLLLEIESVILSEDEDHLDKCSDEIVNMLRSISFISDHSLVPTFLNDVLVQSYSATLPKILVTIFNELMQPLPDVLEGFDSPNTSIDDPLEKSTHSQTGSFGFQPASNNSSHSDIILTQPSRRNRRSVQYPSLSNLGSKKQIMVKLDNKSLNKKEKKIKGGCKTSSKASKYKQKENDAVKVRRNLFEGERPKLDRRQSVAVMEGVRRSPRKHFPTSTFKSPSEKKSPSRFKVADTPCHKQKSNPLWRKQVKERQRSISKDDIQVIQESPMKGVEGSTETEVKASPCTFRKKPAVSRRSFYSASSTRSRPRNVTAYYNLGDRIAGRHRSNSYAETDSKTSLSQLAESTSQCSKFMSPTRSTRNFLLSQLMSPSPHKSPAKLFQSPKQKGTLKTPKKTPSRMLFESPRSSRKNSSARKYGIPCQSSHTPKKYESSSCFVEETPEKFTPSKTTIVDSRRHSPRTSGMSKENINLFCTPSKNDRKISATEASPTATDVTPKKTHTPQRKAGKETLSTPSGTFKQLSVGNSNHTDESDNTPSKSRRNGTSNKICEKTVADSPYQNTRSHGSATPTRNSVCTALFKASPPKVSPTTKHSDDRLVFKTPQKTLRLKSPPINLSNTKFSSPDKDGSSKLKNYKTSENPTFIIRTPSPNDAAKSQSSDFDNWPRRKRRRESPGFKHSLVKESVNLGEWGIDNPENVVPFIHGRKRSLISSTQEINIESPNKRQRLDSDKNPSASMAAYKHSYFSSSTNTFLEQSVCEDDENMMPDASIDSHNTLINALQKKDKSSRKSPTYVKSKKVTPERTEPLNVDNPLSSPVLRGRTISPTLKSCRTPSYSLKESPHHKKYSPSISSNSLVQLINSPLLHSDNTKGKTTHSKSRKSLQLSD